MYNVKDNAETKLQFWISSIATNLTVEEWTASVFPIPPFIAVLNKRDENWGIIKSEKIEVTDIDWDNLTIVRWFENSEKLDFNAWDYISLFVMARHIQDLQEWLNKILQDISEEWLVKPATEDISWTVKIATTEQVNNIVNKEKWVFLMPRVSDLVQEYIWATFISASNIKLWADTYVYQQPVLWECSKEFYIGKDNTNKILDIQWLSNGRGFDLVGLKLSKAWLPTTKLIVELMSASINWNFWKWDTVLAKWELRAEEITATWHYTIQLNKAVNLSLWTPFVIRLRQTDNIANALNYYSVYWHPSHNSDIFSWNYINWNTITNTLNDIYFDCTWKITQAIRQDTNGRLDYKDTYTKRSAEVVASWFSYPFNISSPDIDPNYPITLSWTIQFVQHANNGATLYNDNPAQWRMRYLWVDSNKVRDISANGRTYTITLNNKSVTPSDLANWIIEIIGQSSLSTWDHRWSECYFTISWDLVLNFTDINSWWDVQEIYIRNPAYRLWLVSATIVWRHVDWSFIYPKNDGSHAVIAWQKGDNWKEILLKVQDKCFYYKYDWDLNWNKLSNYYDFIWPEWPQWPIGPRWPMWWINYRWVLESESELPEEWEIEWEAYSINWVLYIWNWEQFTNSNIPETAITFCTDWENIENKPDIVGISDEVALQISKWNWDYPRRLTERCYTQINLLWRNINLPSWEDVNEIQERYYWKIISHDYLYSEYVVKSQYALTFFNRKNTNYLFNYTEWLDTQIWYIDNSLWIENVDDVVDLANKYYWKVVADNNFYNNYITKSSVAMWYFNKSQTNYLFNLDDLFYQQLNWLDTSAWFEDWDSFDDMLLLPEEMWKFWNSLTCRTFYSHSTDAATKYNTVSEWDEVNILLTTLWEDTSLASTYSAFFWNDTLMTKFIASDWCLHAVCNNTAAYTAMCSSATCVNKIITSTTAMNIIFGYSAVATAILTNNTSKPIVLASDQFMRACMSSDNWSAALVSNTSVLSTICTNIAYAKVTFRNQDVMKSALYTAFQPYSFKLYTTLKNNLTWTKYYSSDRDRSECWTKIEYRNTYYTFWATAVIFPAYYWDDWDSRSQQLRSKKFWLNVWYPHSSYANQQNIDILAMSSDSKPMWFALKGCSAVNLWGSNNWVWIIMYTIPTA